MSLYLDGTQLMQRTRRLTDDRDAPYFIDDTEMWRWITEAERVIARKTECLREVREYVTVADEKWLAKTTTGQADVVRVRDAWLMESGRRYRMRVLNNQERLLADGARTEWDYGLGSSYASNDTPGKPRSLINGRRTDYFELVAVPDDVYDLELDLIVYPTTEIAGATDIPEIDQEFHVHIPTGAAALALDDAATEHYDRERLRGLQGKWSAILRSLERRVHVKTDEAGQVQFSGNGVW